MANRSSILSVRARGEWAVFTRPELKSERVSYNCITPSAARGILEAILWKPAIAWRVERIKVLSPIRFTSIRRNEVNNRITVPNRKVIQEGGALWRYFSDEDRAQRNTIALRWVDYIIEARIELTGKAGPEDNLKKFEEMFKRRVENGQQWHAPYLGCRECAAEVMPVDGAPKPQDITRDLGIMLWDIDYGSKKRTPRFFNASLKHGVLEVPENPEATLDALAKGGAA